MGIARSFINKAIMLQVKWELFANNHKYDRDEKIKGIIDTLTNEEKEFHNYIKIIKTVEQQYNIDLEDYRKKAYEYYFAIHDLNQVIHFNLQFDSFGNFETFEKQLYKGICEALEWKDDEK